MPKRAAKLFLTIVLILAVCVLGAQSAGHWHENPLDEQHCQVCHIGHVPIPNPTIQTEANAPAPIARFIPAIESVHHIDAIRTLSSPRAPPQSGSLS